MTRLRFTCIGLLLLCLSCESTKGRYQKIASELSRLEQAQLNDFSSPAALFKALQQVDSLQQTADQLLPTDDPRRLEQPYSPILNRLRDYQLYLRQYQSRASLYNIAGHLQRVLAQEGTPLEEKSSQCRAFLQEATAYYQGAKVKLISADSSELRLAIRKQILGLNFLGSTYADSIRRLPEAQQQDRDIETCRYAIKDYIAWCNSQLIEQSQ
jgi:hypothetical protein